MNKIVYHGSANGNIKVLTPHKSTHQKECIYATENKTAALLFMAQGSKDLDTRIGTVNEKLQIVERREGVLDSLYNQKGYLYILDGSTFKHYDYLWSLEVISFAKEIKPLKKVVYPNILDELIKEEKKGNLTIYRYPNRPKDMPLDNSDLIEKYIRYEESGLTGAIEELLSIYPEFTSKVAEKKLEYKNKKHGIISKEEIDVWYKVKR